jgi:ElaB/YqjD/DUF883 family membrane-anchored ribosome-binding protein
MDQEPDVIREQIDETRSALTDKLETLEEQVRETVQSAKATVEGTIENVKSSVQETVRTVKRTFDLPYQVDRHPWAMMGGSFLAGLALGKWLEGQPSLARDYPSYGGAFSEGPPRPAVSEAAPRYEPDFNRSAAYSPPAAAPPSKPGVLGGLLHQFEDEIEQVKGVAIGALMGVVRDLAKQSLPKLAPQIDEVMNSATSKVGGRPVAGPLLEPSATETGFCREEAVSKPAAWH